MINMRDPNRIEPIMEELTKMWKKHPDMRLGQFLCNILGEADTVTNRDPFYVEDDEIIDVFKEIPWLKEDNWFFKNTWYNKYIRKRNDNITCGDAGLAP